MLRGPVLSNGACGDRLLAIEETLILCGLAGFFAKYETVFLAGKNVYKTRILREGVVNSHETLLCAGIVSVRRYSILVRE